MDTSNVLQEAVSPAGEDGQDGPEDHVEHRLDLYLDVDVEGVEVTP